MSEDALVYLPPPAVPSLAAMLSDDFEEHFFSTTPNAEELLSEYRAGGPNFRHGMDAAIRAVCGMPLEALIDEVTAERMELERAAGAVTERDDVGALIEERDG